MQIAEREKSIPWTYIYRSLSWLGTGTSIKSGGVKLVLLGQTFLLSEMMLSCMHVSKNTKPAYITRLTALNKVEMYETSHYEYDS